MFQNITKKSENMISIFNINEPKIMEGGKADGKVILKYEFLLTIVIFW